MRAGILRAPSDADVARGKRIDRYIDYFGSGGPRGNDVTRDPCGESLDVSSGRPGTDCGDERGGRRRGEWAGN